MTRLAWIAGLILIATPSATSAEAREWVMIHRAEDGKQVCGPPLEAEGVKLTPDVILERMPNCKLMDETPSIELDAVMVQCGDNVYPFLSSMEKCQEIVKSNE